jgi:hypothetical protein
VCKCVLYCWHWHPITAYKYIISYITGGSTNSEFKTVHGSSHPSIYVDRMRKTIVNFSQDSLSLGCDSNSRPPDEKSRSVKSLDCDNISVFFEIQKVKGKK